MSENENHSSDEPADRPVGAALDSESEELLSRYAKGDDSALGRLIDKNAGRMKGYAARKIPGDLRRRIDASDIYQQMSIELLRIRGRFQNQGPGAFAAMLRTMTDFILQRAVERERTQKRDPNREKNLHAHEHSELGDPFDGIDAEMSTPSVVLSRKEHLAQLAEAFEQLAEQDREVILAIDYRGQSYAELVEELGVSAEALRKRHSRAVVRLRELMGEKED